MATVCYSGRAQRRRQPVVQDAAAREQGCAADALDLRVAWRAPTGPESGVAETAGLNAEENRCDSGEGTGQ